MSAAVPRLPKSFPDAATAHRRTSETINNILGFQFDDSRIQTPAEAAAGVTPVNYAYGPSPEDPRRFGADPTGVSDSRAALNNASLTGVPLAIYPGTYLVNSNVTITPNVVFQPGAILKPANGVSITFASAITAGPWQIFDLSLGGLIALPRSCGDVWAEWWGAMGDLVKTDNEVPINQAITALAAAVSPTGVYGGTVHLDRGDFFISDSVNLADEVSIHGRGFFFTLLKVNAATFNPATTQMVLGKNGTSPMFNSRVEHMRLDAADQGTITNVIYAPAWQEKCGTDNVYIGNFKTNGILIDTGYGGIAQVKFRRTEFSAATDCFAGFNISINLPAGTVGWTSVELEEISLASQPATVTFTAGVPSTSTSATLAANWPYATGAWLTLFSDGESRAVTYTNGLTTATWTGGLTNTVTANATATPPNANGISANGRVILNCSDVHAEIISSAITLSLGACLTGNSIQTDGNATVSNIIVCGSNWTGVINARAIKRGAAANFIVDNSRGPYALANAPGLGGYPGGQGGGDYSDQTIWPPDPRFPVAAGRCPGGSSNGTMSYSVGMSSAYVHNSTGNYSFTLSTSMDAVGLYHVVATSDQAQTSVTQSSATVFAVLTRNASGTATDAGWIGIEVSHSP